MTGSARLTPSRPRGGRWLDLWRILPRRAVAVGALVTGLDPLVGGAVPPRPEPRSPATCPTDGQSLEVFYTVVPLVIVAVLFGLTMRTQHRDHQTSRAPTCASRSPDSNGGGGSGTRRRGSQSPGDANEPPTLVLPVGAKVRLRLVSADVIHSFFVPAFLVKRDLIPGVDNRIDITPTEPGRYPAVCAPSSAAWTTGA